MLNKSFSLQSTTPRFLNATTTHNYFLEQTQALVNELVTEQQQLAMWGGGAMSAAAYDTAWVAMIRDQHQPDTKLAFPASFEWLVKHQATDGSWGNSPNSAEYAIVPTLAGLLALCKASCSYGTVQVQQACQRAQTFLAEALAEWGVAKHESVGFEVLVPSLLEQLEQVGIFFEFAGKEQLIEFYDHKMSLAGPDLIYSGKSNLVHSLEAFGASLDYTKLKSLQTANGSYGCSPAATAAVLIYSKEWDRAAERWLSHLTEQAFDGEAGSMPNAYPIDAFEAAWVLYNLGQSLDLVQTFEPFQISQIRNWLKKSIAPQAGGSISRFGGIPVDSDDTGMILAALNLVGARQVPIESLWGFERDSYFACFEAERGVSVSANAHVLAALTTLPIFEQNKLEVATRIHKLVNFLMDVREPDGYWTDKWHISPYYATASVVLAIKGNEHYNKQLLPTLDWVLETQSPDGGWGIGGQGASATLEETAYAIQILTRLASLLPSKRQLAQALRRGQNYISSSLSQEMSATEATLPKLWRGKELYAPTRVVQSAIYSVGLLRC